MSSTVQSLKSWFDALNIEQQKEVVEFLYGGKALHHRGLYCGPLPGLVTKGLYCGPAPAAAASQTCPVCGRPM